MNNRRKFYFFSMLVIILLLYRSFPKIDILTWSFLLMTQAETDFLKNWCRLQQSQLDVDSHLGPCQTCVKSSVKCERNSAKTTDIKRGISRKDIRPAGDFSHIFIKTRDTSGQFRLEGGDTWKAYVEGPSFLSASVFDLKNGTYEVVFLPVLPGKYRVHVILMDSGCNGILEPQKRFPYLGKLSYYVDIPKEKKEQLLQRLQYQMKFRDQFGPSILNFQRCCGFCGACNYLWNGYGTWENETEKIRWRPYIKIDDRPRKVRYPKRVIRKNGTLWFYGDQHSQIYQSVMNRPLCENIFRECKNPIDLYPKEDLRKTSIHNMSRLILSYLQLMITYAQELPDNALIINSAFIGHLPYKHYTVIVDKIAQFLHDSFNSSVHTQVVWSTMTSEPGSRDNIHYPLYNAYANWKMCDTKIPILDVFSLADSYPHSFSVNKSITDYPFESVERLLEDYFERTAYR